MSVDARIRRAQFAYRPHVGARDALALLLLSWLCALSLCKKVGVYLSDVAGAFDRVSTQRPLRKLQKKEISPRMLKVVASWL